LNNASISVYDSARRRSAALEELVELFKYRNLVSQLVRRDILTRYKRSVLGVAWTMLNPLGTMLVMTIVFSRVFGNHERGYPAYVLSGFMAWNFFSQTTNAAIINLVWGGGLLNRIYIPRTAFAVSAVGTGLVNMGLSLVPLIFVTIAIGVPIKLPVLLLPIPILLMAMFALGLGLLISTIAIYFADVAEMYQVILTAWMYLSPVIWTDTFIPAKYLVWIARLNPMYGLIKMFRAAIYEGRVPTGNEFLITAGYAIVTLLVGWFVFARKADEFAYRV
jgi:ABC-2 type transport system permease protein